MLRRAPVSRRHSTSKRGHTEQLHKATAHITRNTLIHIVHPRPPGVSSSSSSSGRRTPTNSIQQLSQVIFQRGVPSVSYALLLYARILPVRTRKIAKDSYGSRTSYLGLEWDLLCSSKEPYPHPFIQRYDEKKT